MAAMRILSFALNSQAKTMGHLRELESGPDICLRRAYNPVSNIIKHKVTNMATVRNSEVISCKVNAERNCLNVIGDFRFH